MDSGEKRQAANEELREVSRSWMCSYETLVSCGDTGVKCDAVVGFLHFWSEMPSWKIPCINSLTSRQEGACGFVAAVPEGTTESSELT